LLVGVERAGIIESGPMSEVQICPGCAHACVLDVSFASEFGFIQCNQTDVDYGLIELGRSELRQWYGSRSRLIAFVARELKLSPKDRDDRAVHIRLGTWAGARLRRAIALEFTDTAILRIGDAETDLSELMRWDGRRVCIDHEELEIRASQSTDPQTGGKRYQQSRLKQRYRAHLTKLRNLRLQEMADQLKRRTPAMKKIDIAKALIASGEFGIVGPETVARIIRVPTKMRRKNLA
jgi:GAF domain-containing protein